MSNTQSLTHHKFRQFRSVDNLTSIAREIALTPNQATKSMLRYNVMRSSSGSVDTESLSSEKGGYHRTESRLKIKRFKKSTISHVIIFINKRNRRHVTCAFWPWLWFLSQSSCEKECSIVISTSLDNTLTSTLSWHLRKNPRSHSS